MESVKSWQFGVVLLQKTIFVMKRTRIIEVDSNPGKCPKCGGNVVPILYGEPTAQTYEEYLQGKLALGGCCITQNDPDWVCLGCDQQFRMAHRK